jgi:hypothetical protein
MFVSNSLSETITYFCNNLCLALTDQPLHVLPVKENQFHKHSLSFIELFSFLQYGQSIL